MAYIGLARKWRPQIFDDLIGQQHIARTLSNAIISNRLGQSYLFTGTRGVGKTSAARIFAKAIRCGQPVAPAVPCNQCQDCHEISEGRSNDVLEIDGASNNGVDAIRELRESAKYLPATGKYKIYIIDEVHMLTTAAFNALLKTLEEPPAHLVFLFATTDPQKIPATILSRCQRFDFKRVNQTELMNRLQNICKTEKVEITLDALQILAREAEGSMRDALSLLEQVLAAGHKNLTEELVIQTLGLIDKATILKAVQGILERKPLQTLEASNEIYLHGYDLKLFTKELLRYLRLLMMVQILEQNRTEPTKILEITDTDLVDLKKLSSLRSLTDLDILFSLLNHSYEDVARSQLPKTILDVLLIKMSASEELVSIQNFEVPSMTAPQLQPQPLLVRTEPTVIAPTKDKSWWPIFVNKIKQQKPLMGTLLEHVMLESIQTTNSGVTITLAYSHDQSFYKDQLQLRSNAEILNQYFKEQFGHAVRLEYKEVLLAKSLEQQGKEKKEQELAKQKQKILESEAMRAAQEVLGGHLEKFEFRGEL